LITIISCDYLNLLLVNEYIGDVTIPTQVIKYNQTFLQVDQPIKLNYYLLLFVSWYSFVGVVFNRQGIRWFLF